MITLDDWTHRYRYSSIYTDIYRVSRCEESSYPSITLSNMIEHILTWNQSTSIFLNTFTENSIMRIILPYFSDVPIFIIPIFLISYWIYAIIR